MFGEARRQPVGLGDLLLWYGMVDDGVLLQHDGSLLAAWSFRGPDLQSATHSEMNAIATRLASILRLGGGWMVQVDSFRTKVNEYGPKGAFPDRLTALIDKNAEFNFNPREATLRVSTSSLSPIFRLWRRANVCADS